MSNFLSPNFIFGEFKIGTVSEASCVNIGNNWPTDFKSYKKQNQGFGSVGGDNNEFSNATALVYDPDTVDMVNTADGDVPEWVKDMIADRMEQLPADDNDDHSRE